MATIFVTVQNPDVGTDPQHYAEVPETALPYLTGWKKVPQKELKAATQPKND